MHVLTQATVDVHSSQVVEIGVYPFSRFRGSCGPGLVSLSRVFPAVVWGAVSLSFSRYHSSGGTGCLSPNAHRDGVQVWTVSRKSTRIDFHPLMTHPYGWMTDSSESSIGEVSVQGGRDAEGLFRVTRFGGIQPASVVRATTDIGAER